MQEPLPQTLSALLRPAVALTVLAVFQFAVATGAFAQDAEKITWDDHAAPVFKARCAGCHNPNKKSADLDVSSYIGIMAGGASGTAVEPGDSDGSYLFSLVTHRDEPVMPPGGTKIPDPDIAIIQKWIDGGALESQSSKARPTKKKVSLAATTGALTRPENVSLFPRLRVQPVLETERPATVTAMATHPWAPVVAVAAPHQVFLYDTNTLQLTGVLDFPEGQPHVVRFSRSGSVLLAAGGKEAMSGKVVLWDVATGNRIAEIGDELDAVLAADISSDHSLVALGGPQKIVRVYSTVDGSKLYEIEKHTDWITAIEFSPDSVLLATGDRNGGLFVWHAPTGNEYLTLAGHTAGITATTWRHDSNMLVSASQDTTVRAWELENGAQVKSIGAHGGGVTMAVYDRDGNLATVGRDNTVKQWNPAGEALRTFPALPDIGTSVAVSLESGRVFGGDWQGNVVSWNAADGAEAGRLDLTPPNIAARLAAAEQTLAAATEAHTTASMEMGKLQEQLAAIQQQHTAAMAESSALQTALTTEQATMNGLVTERTTLETSMTALTAESVTLTALLPQLTELSGKAQSVAELSGGDAELAAASQQIAARLAASQTRASEVTQSMSTATARIAEIATTVGTMESGVIEKQKMLDAAAATVVALKSEVDAANQTVAQAAAHLQQLSADLAAAQAGVERWKNELAFMAELDQLLAAISEAEAGVSAAEEARAAAAEKLAAAQSLVESATAGVQTAEQKRDEFASQLDHLRGVAK